MKVKNIFMLGCCVMTYASHVQAESKEPQEWANWWSAQTNYIKDGFDILKIKSNSGRDNYANLYTQLEKLAQELDSKKYEDYAHVIYLTLKYGDIAAIKKIFEELSSQGYTSKFVQAYNKVVRIRNRAEYIRRINAFLSYFLGENFIRTVVLAGPEKFKTDVTNLLTQRGEVTEPKLEAVLHRMDTAQLTALTLIPLENSDLFTFVYEKFQEISVSDKAYVKPTLKNKKHVVCVLLERLLRNAQQQKNDVTQSLKITEYTALWKKLCNS